MKIGQLKQRITLQIPTYALTSIDEKTITWVDQATVYAAIIPNTGKLFYEAQQAKSEIQGVIKIRYRTDIIPTMRIKYGNRYFKILAIINKDEANEELHIMYNEALD